MGKGKGKGGKNGTSNKQENKRGGECPGVYCLGRGKWEVQPLKQLCMAGREYYYKIEPNTSSRRIDIYNIIYLHDQ